MYILFFNIKIKILYYNMEFIKNPNYKSINNSSTIKRSISMIKNLNIFVEKKASPKQ